MSAKLDLINECLVLTGNNVVATEDDGSDEWLAGSTAYEVAINYLLGAHDWKFATAIETSPNRTGDPDDENYTDAYAKPNGTLGLVWVKIGGVATDWRIVGNQVYVNGDSDVSIKYVRAPDPEEWPPGFKAALRLLTLSGILQGLNEDYAEANRQRLLAEEYIAQARQRSDREEAPRAVFVSTILQRRRGTLAR